MYPSDDQTVKALEENCKLTRAAYNENKCAATLRPYISANIAHLNSLLHPDLRIVDQYDGTPNAAEHADSVVFEEGYFDYRGE